MLLTVLVACSSGDDFDARSAQRRRVAQEYGISPAETVDVRDGSRIVFFGDSITAGGVGDDGYVTLVKEAIDGLYPDRDIEVRGSGVIGDQVSDLSRRLERDVLIRKPTHVVIYVGVNDVASLGPGTAAVRRGREAYRRGLTDLVTRIRQGGAWVMICTPTVIGEDVNDGSSTNEALEQYADAARAVAADLQTGLCDLRREFFDYLSTRNDGGRRSGILTVDGIHLNAAGNRLVAGTVLRALVTTATPVPDPQPVAAQPASPAPRPPRPASASRALSPTPAMPVPEPSVGILPSADPSPSPEPVASGPAEAAPEESPGEPPSDSPTPTDSGDPTPGP